MLTSLTKLVGPAQAGGYAVGAFNVYNLEEVRAVIAAAEAESSPVILQLLPAALAYGGAALVDLCLSAARHATVPVSVHLDHCASADTLAGALRAGMPSVMADGSHLDYAANVAFTREMAALAHAAGATIEAELGRISGNEDGLTVAAREQRMTDPAQAADFVVQTGVDALAVCIGNVHGRYPGEPRLDFARLEAIRAAVPVPLVLHGASGLPDAMIRRCITLGVTKINVNTELRHAYLDAARTCLAQTSCDLLDLITHTTAAVQAVVAHRLRAFGSSGQGGKEAPQPASPIHQQF